MKPWSANAFQKVITEPKLLRKLSITDDEASALVQRYDEYLARLQDPRNAPTPPGEPTHMLRAVYKHPKTAYANYNFYGKSSEPSPLLTITAEGGFWIERVQLGGQQKFNILQVCESDFKTPARMEKGKKFYVCNSDTKLNPDSQFVRASIDMSRSDVTKANLFFRIVGNEAYVKAVESGLGAFLSYVGRAVEKGPWNIDSVTTEFTRV